MRAIDAVGAFAVELSDGADAAEGAATGWSAAVSGLVFGCADEDVDLSGTPTGLPISLLPRRSGTRFGKKKAAAIPPNNIKAATAMTPRQTWLRGVGPCVGCSGKTGATGVRLRTTAWRG